MEAQKTKTKITFRLTLYPMIKEKYVSLSLNIKFNISKISHYVCF